MLLANGWTEYKILCSGDGEKLEDWNGIKLLRPDPQIIWPSKTDLSRHNGLHARYTRSATGGGRWESLQSMPEEWDIHYKDLTFRIKPTGFKHTGLFPEQAANWDMIRALIRTKNEKRKTKNEGQGSEELGIRSEELGVLDKAKSGGAERRSLTENRLLNSSAVPHFSFLTPHSSPRVLNLFAYTGGATAACAKEGAFVTHVDAAKGMVERAKLNCKLSGIGEKNVRWIVEDCKKFLTRELRRGQTYDAIIMDPPSYGRAPDGEVWKLEDNLFGLVELCAKVLSPEPLFFLLNSYTTGLGASVMQNLLNIALKPFMGTVEAYELCLPTEEEGICLPCGNSAVWTTHNAHRTMHNEGQ